jgi:NAD+ synthase (glutamine-hydrolysing)
MCVPGYLLGDLFEDESFIKDIHHYNRKIIRSIPDGITVIFGSLVFDSRYKNEDGRARKYNAAIIASDGKIRKVVCKTLQPNYRIFDDDRHFYSNRKYAALQDEPIFNCLAPIKIKTRVGLVKIGVILCEDMWHEDYPIDPTGILVVKGADLVVNISASPRTWRKNLKRHRVVRELLEKNPVTFVYVNNVGVQNNGKNIVAFDGSSTIYNRDGNIIFAVTPYSEGNHYFVFTKHPEIDQSSEPKFSSLAEQIAYDASELYAGWECAVRGAFKRVLPPQMRKAVIGLSGGIDSAVDAALLVRILGKENVIGVNMPSHFNSQQTQDLAQDIARNLGINYLVVPIDGVVDAIFATTSQFATDLSYENIQARARQEILAARAQNWGGVFICNSNKIEMAFGYGTLYGDISGFIAPLGDMLKYEVYQMGDYLNRVIYQREVIPQECFKIAPSAELRDKQVDPFHYGNLERRGYHDELVRAFVEFRYHPEIILEKYLDHSLETEFRLIPGTIDQLFKTPRDFVADLEKNYQLFIGSYFKRIQCPPIPILSKRAFGYDLRESLLPPLFTHQYQQLKKRIK